MKISKVIYVLNEYLDKYGDLNIIDTYENDFDESHIQYCENFNINSETDEETKTDEYLTIFG